jgi:hypothetical protein
LDVGVGILKMARRIGQQAFDDFDAVELAEKVGVPKIAAKLAVGDSLHANVFLHLHGIANAAVFDLAQLRVIDPSLLALLPRLQQLPRTQEATDVIGAKRRDLLISHDYFPSSDPGARAP